MATLTEDEKLAKELQAQYDAEYQATQPANSAQDEEVAKRVQVETDIADEFEAANRRFHAEKDAKTAAKLQKEEAYASGSS
mmetsp:Transcript_1663/g.1883  ORF Transcript_1663/g.1883 Transcript_1663/m.1883 type:complete len:81 (+) Transcript_1663:94-336(+)|eukprot:CAMPEP_0197848290 /NCGR_PEP_ID=MMETSP1438-20131217/8145_1 /TAXON_ID=1461541 /ORGANISM="Pterosperma sp., Strain CCMP1384" /LENGTH=80 /DNA_ID=CAMNT_0043460451 /DNA_START=86 /DNA_END=328 /DNA_ORIENTATION=+